MSWSIEVEGGSSVRLPTKGKYCDRDIVVTAKGGSDDLAHKIIMRTVTEISDDSVVSIGMYAFAGCSMLTEAIFTNCITVSTNVFLNCSRLVSASLPKLTLAGLNMFTGCSALKNVNIPEVTSLYSNAFQACTALEVIDLPKCTKLNAQSFAGCTSLKTVILRSDTAVTLGATTVFTGSTLIENGTGYIYVPAALVESYKQSTNWLAMVSEEQFRAIEDYPDICGG